MNLADTTEILPSARFALGEHLLAPWRITERQLSCLALPSATPPDVQAEGAWVSSGQQVNIDADLSLLITGTDLGIADVLLLCQQIPVIANHALILLSAETFPFVIKPARFMVSQLPEAIGACALLEDWGFANRLFGAQMGCYDTSLAQWLQESTRNHSEFDRIVSFE